MAQPAIQIKNFSLAYRGNSLFKHFNVTFIEGRWSCILGPSGIGKSSLLRAIAGLTTVDNIQTSGTIEFATKLGAHPTAFLAQADGLLPWLTLQDNVLLGYRLRKQCISSQQTSKAQHLLAQVGLSNVSQDYPNTLSVGMRQRVALARTMMENKAIVLMDEPFAAVDTLTKHSLHHCVTKQFQRKTVILVTHDPLEALRLSHTIYIMQGTPLQLKCVYQQDNNAQCAKNQSHLFQTYQQLCQKLHIRYDEESA